MKQMKEYVEVCEESKRKSAVYIPMIAAASAEIVPNDSSCFAIALTFDCRFIQ